VAYSLDKRALIPLSEIIEQADFPLSDYLPLDQLAAVFDNLYYTEAVLSDDGDNLVIEIRLAWEGALELRIPGCDLFSLVLASAGTEWSTVAAIMVIGPDFSITLDDLTFGLRFDESVLKDVNSNGPAEVTITGDVGFSPDGITIENATGPSLDPAYLCGTGIIVEAQDIRPVFGIFDLPEFLVDHEDFQGVAIELLAVTIPAEYLNTDPGADLQIAIANAAIGSTGFTGKCEVLSADLANPVSGRFLGYPLRFKRFGLDIVQNALIEAALAVDIHLDTFDEGGNEKWIGLDVSFNANGNFSAALSAVQPPEAGGGAASLVTIGYPNVADFAINSARVARNGGIYEIYMSGGLKILLDGATWPEITFDEIGINSNGELLLPEGAGITFASPLVVQWYFVRLTIAKFRFARGESSQTSLLIALSAEVNLVEGVPAGASVEGLTIEWDPSAGGNPSVSFEGIGVQFAVAGAFSAGIEVAFKNEAGVIEFRGQGALELYALDMAIDVGIIIGYNQADDFAFLYLFADARLLPTGIPIAQTGLSIYGFQGLITANMALQINTGLAADERYYEVFTRPPIGITHMSKWAMNEGQNAMGVGIVIGTADKGFSLNVKGLLVIAFPDITLLLQCRANFLKTKPDLSTSSEGNLDALLVYASGQSTLSIDIVAYWGMPHLFQVTGAARAFFSFSGVPGWFLMIGENSDGKRVSAQVLEVNNTWLFSAGFWFRLDEDGVLTGIKVEVGERYSRKGFWIEARGSAKGKMGLHWNPSQWEGSLKLAGRIGAGYKGVSVGIRLGGYLGANVFRPTEVRLRARACFSALLWDVCKSHTFKWKRPNPPQLESPLVNWAATPRHWTPDLTGTARPDENSQVTLDTGLVRIAGGTPTIKPHSAISLDFARAMKDDTGDFNEAVALSDDGFVTIGQRSNYSARYVLNDVELIRDPGGADENIALWGTWARETPHYNTVLRLLSSKRFGHDGTSSSSFVEPLDIDYCDEPEDTVVCFPLDDLEPGYGWLPDGSLYHWEVGDPDDDSRDNEGGVTLGEGDVLTIIPPGPVKDPEVVTKPDDGNGARPDGWWWKRLCRIPACRLVFAAAVAIVLALLMLLRPIPSILPPHVLLPILLLVALLLLVWVWMCHCRRRRGEDCGSWDKEKPSAQSTDKDPPDEKPTDPDDQTPGADDSDPDDTDDSPTETKPAEQDEQGSIVIKPEKGKTFTRICYKPGHGPSQWVTGTQSGGTLTTHEEWTVPPEAQILQPNQLYELRVSHTPQLKGPGNSVDSQLGSPVVESRRFRTSGPPLYVNALINYVQKVYPSNGNRPVYTGYDLEVVFHEAYVPFLYTSVGAQLRLRLLDGQGNVIRDAEGNVLLLVVSSEGEVTQRLSELWWERVYRENVTRGCIEGVPDFSIGYNTADIDLASVDAALTPNSQYIAQLVSNDAIDVPLFEWSFTTSAFETFTQLLSSGLSTDIPHVTLDDAATAGDFDTVCRRIGLRTINYVDRSKITPILNIAQDRVLGLLIEAPEPLDAVLRLTVTLDNNNTRLIANVDQTRVIVVHHDGDSWPKQPLALKATWLRDIGSVGQTYAVAGDTAAEEVEYEVML